MADFLQELQRHVLIFDGAMGANVPRHNLPPENFRGEEGCNELPALSEPDAIRSVPASFLADCRDAIETDSSGSTSIVPAGYDLQDRTRKLNLATLYIIKEK